MQKKDKKGAMYCLKKKKMVQGQVDTIMGTMITLEQQKMALENAATCVQCFPACSLYVGNMWAYARSCGIVIRGFSTRAEGPPSLLGVSLGCLRAPGVPRLPHAVASRRRACVHWHASVFWAAQEPPRRGRHSGRQCGDFHRDGRLRRRKGANNLTRCLTLFEVHL